MYDLGLLTSTKVSFERVQTCTIHTNFSIFHCSWCCNGHKWWALHDQRHLKCVGTRPEGPCPLHNFVPTIDHIHVEICTKKLFQAAMIFFLPAAGPYQVWYQDLYMVNWSLTLLKKNRLRWPGWGWPLLTKNSCYRGRMNCLIWHKKHCYAKSPHKNSLYKIAFYWGRVYGFGKYHRGKVYDSLEEYSPLIKLSFDFRLQLSSLDPG